MEQVAAFDVDGTLIHQVGKKEDTPRYDVINLFKRFEKIGFKMVIWSGGGMDYAERWAEKLGLEAEIWPKHDITRDKDSVAICFDDEKVKLAKVNVQV